VVDGLTVCQTDRQTLFTGVCVGESKRIRENNKEKKIKF
jgi:hypothetical protein